MNDERHQYELIACEHLEAAKTYQGLVNNKLADLDGFEVVVVPDDNMYRVVFLGDKSVFRTMENFLGSIIVRLFFF